MSSEVSTLQVAGESGAAVVTGAAGFIGSHLVEALLASGDDVVAVDRAAPPDPPAPPAPTPADPLPPGARPAPPGASPPARASAPPTTRLASAPAGSLGGGRRPAVARGARRVVRGDLLALDLDACFAGARVVFHLAALPGVRPSWRRFPEYLDCNVLATQRVVDACVRAGVERLVVASSSSVYGGASGTMDESRVPRPLSPYGVTKLAGERLALAYAARPDVSLAVTALRFFTVYGPGQRPDMLFSRLVRAALAETPIEVYGDGTQLRDFVYVADVVRALRLAGAAEGSGGQVLNVGTGEAVSINEAIALTGALTDTRVDARYGPPRAGDATATTADTARARERLGFRAATSLRDGLAAQIARARAESDRSGTASGRARAEPDPPRAPGTVPRSASAPAPRA